jgi:AraC family transcriptional regulator
MQVAGIGRAIFWEGGSLWLALITRGNDVHSHHAIQICLPLSGEARFRGSDEEPWRSYAGALITPDLPHAFGAPGNIVANLLFEPESRAGRGLLKRYPSPAVHRLPKARVAELVAPLREAYFAEADDPELIRLAKNAISVFAGVEESVSPADPRVLRVIDHVRRHLDEPIRLKELASEVGLSPGRLRHLFVEQTGVSTKAFVLWERLNKALALGFSGESWTEAAYAANFADSAHLTRTCRRMLGLVPSGAVVKASSGGRRLTK